MNEVSIYPAEEFLGDRHARPNEIPDRIQGGKFVAPCNHVVSPGGGGLIPDPEPYRLTITVPAGWEIKETTDGGCGLFAPGSRDSISADEAYGMAVRGEQGISTPRRGGRA